MPYGSKSTLVQQNVYGSFSSTFGEAKAPSHMNRTNTAVAKVTAGTSSPARQYGKVSLSFKRAGEMNSVALVLASIMLLGDL